MGRVGYTEERRAKIWSGYGKGRRVAKGTMNSRQVCGQGGMLGLAMVEVEVIMEADNLKSHR